MFEDRVSDVTGKWIGDSLQVNYIHQGLRHHDLFSRNSIGALSLWLKQDHPPTPAEIAARLVERWDRNTDLAEASWGEKLADLARQIEAALEAERAREAT